MTRTYFLLLLFTYSIWGCQSLTTPDYYHLPTYNEDGTVNVIVEIPAGTNKKIEYRPNRNVFESDQVEGQERRVRFLPYPGNYGFIPSTLMDKSRGGDGDALDVLLLAEHLPTQTQVASIPIAALRLEDQGALDTKIIAVPADSLARVLPIRDYEDFLIQYDAVKYEIEHWFLHYKGHGQVKFLGWENDDYARREIKKWTLSELD